MTNKLIITNGNRDEIVSKEKILEALKDYHTIQGQCKLCIDASHQDFPGFYGSLEYNENKKIINKDIIIIGREVSNRASLNDVLKKHYNLTDCCLHIWYDFGYYKESELHLLYQNAPLWKNLDLFFPLTSNLLRIYGTDIAKCYSKTRLKKNYKDCTETVLLDELNCFKDENLILVIQGKDVYWFFKKYFNFCLDSNFNTFLNKNEKAFFEHKLKFTKTREFKFEIGTFSSKDRAKFNKNGKYLLIPHSSAFNRGLWKRIRDNKDNGIIKELIEKIRFYFKE